MHEPNAFSDFSELPSELPPDEEVLARYLVGDTNAGESARVHRWMEATPGRAQTVSAIQQWWKTGAERHGSNQRAEAVDTAFSTVLHRIDRSFDQPVKRFPGWSRSIAFRSVIGSVMAIALALVFVPNWTRTHANIQDRPFGMMSTYATGNGQRSVVMLPDGTTVQLNVASQLRVSSEFNRGNRTVYLDGEAFFTVTHREDSPFRVIAGNAVATVLGTGFLVRHYPTDSVSTVSVRDGKVSVGAVILHQLQEVQIDRFTRPNVRAADITRFDFVKGILVFNDVPLSEAMDDLRRWYDADIRIGDPSLDARRFTAEFTSGSVADFADVIELALGIRAVRTGKTLTLYPR